MANDNPTCFKNLCDLFVTQLSKADDVDLLPVVLRNRRDLVEMVADLDDDLADEFLFVDDALRVRPESLKAALRRVVLGRKALPVMIGSALKNTGVQVLMDVTQDMWLRRMWFEVL